MANVIGEIKIDLDEEAKELLQAFVRSVDYLVEKDSTFNIHLDTDTINKKIAEMVERHG